MNSAETRRPSRLLSDLAGDLRFALRTLARRPMFAAVAVLTLGLGIGASTAMFSVANGVLFAGGPDEEGGQLVSVFVVQPNTRNRSIIGDFWDRGEMLPAEYRSWRDQTTTLGSVAGHGVAEMTHTGLGTPHVELVGQASSTLFRVLGMRLALGREFLPEEEGLEAGEGARVAILSHAEWRTVFGSDPEVLGKTVTLNGEVYSVVGVLPPGFRLPWLAQPVSDQFDDGRRSAWIPIGSGTPTMRRSEIMALGRLAAGVTMEQAEAEAYAILKDQLRRSDWYFRVEPYKASENRGLVTPLTVLLGAACLLCLIACANVAILVMAEVYGRQKELVTRVALGASRHRLFRQLLTESLFLGGLGAAAGAAFAWLGTGILVWLGPPLPRLDQVGIDGLVLLFTISMGLLSSLLFGAAPALFFGRGSLQQKAGTSTRRVSRFHRGILAAEVALTAMVLVSAGLLARSQFNLLAVDPGFEAENLGILRMSLILDDLEDPDVRGAFLHQVLQEARSLPGVVSAGLTSGVPFPGTSHYEASMLWDDARDPDPETGRPPRIWATSYSVSPGYLETLGISILAGRTFQDTDAADADPVILVDEIFARQYWPDTSPLGARVRGPDNYFTVVGVVGSTKRKALSAEGEPTFYSPLGQRGWPRTVSVVFRTRTAASALFTRIREVVWGVNPDVPITLEQTMTEAVAESTKEAQYRTLLVGFFGVLATLMAAAGVFGVTARFVAFQRREMGVRLALGATSGGLTASTVLGTLRAVALGLLAGFVASLWAGRGLSSLLFGIDGADPLTYGGVFALVGALALVSSFIPARRIATVSPQDVLRAE